MLDEKILKQIISDYEQILAIVSSRLEAMKQIAAAAGIKTSPSRHIMNDAPSRGSSIRAEIEQKREELMAEAEKIRSKAMAGAQQVRDGASKQMPNIESMPGMGSMPNFPGAAMSRMPKVPGMSKVPNIEDYRKKDDEDGR